jgi:hypothetical protein
MKKLFFIISLFILCVSIFSTFFSRLCIYRLTIKINGCISIVRFSYEKTGGILDHSFKAAGSVIETGYLTYTKDTILPRRQKGAPRDGIQISGKLRRMGNAPSKLPMLTLSSDNETLRIGYWHQVYQWNGAIILDGKTEQAELFLHAYSGDKDGYGKSFEYSGNQVTFRPGESGFTSDENKKYIELRSFPVGVVTNFPCPLGNFTTEQNTYKLYMTIEVEYILINDSELSDQEIEQKYGFFRREENEFPNLFYRQNQKFQVVDRDNAVVAEIIDDVYKLYDTLPEHDLSAVKRDIAWFYMYRYLTKYLNGFHGWDIPLFN